MSRQTAQVRSRIPLSGWATSGTTLLCAAILWASAPGKTAAQSLTPTATPDPTPTCPCDCEPGQEIEVNILPYNSASRSLLSSAEETPIPTPTWWPTRTDCPAPTSTPTPECLVPYRGPFYSTEQGPITAEIGQQFRVEIESFHRPECGGAVIHSDIVYSTSVLRLVGVVPQKGVGYYGPVSLDFEAVGAGETQIRVLYPVDPPVFAYLTTATVLPTSPTMTFTPLPTPTPTPTPSATPSPPSASCTPAWSGPFYYSHESLCEAKVMDTISVTIHSYYVDCYCCFMPTNPGSFVYDENIVRVLQVHTVRNCNSSTSEPEKEWIFQALRPGTTDLAVTYVNHPNGYNYTDFLTRINVVATPPPAGMILH